MGDGVGENPAHAVPGERYGPEGNAEAAGGGVGVAARADESGEGLFPGGRQRRESLPEGGPDDIPAAGLKFSEDVGPELGPGVGEDVGDGVEINGVGGRRETAPADVGEISIDGPIGGERQRLGPGVGVLEGEGVGEGVGGGGPAAGRPGVLGGVGEGGAVGEDVGGREGGDAVGGDVVGGGGGDAVPGAVFAEAGGEGVEGGGPAGGVLSGGGPGLREGGGKDNDGLTYHIAEAVGVPTARPGVGVEADVQWRRRPFQAVGDGPPGDGPSGGEGVGLRV